MGRRKGRKKTRRMKIQKANEEKNKRKLEKGRLPPLSSDGLKVALSMASLERIEQIRRA